jgi:hypothetical protein
MQASTGHVGLQFIAIVWWVCAIAVMPGTASAQAVQTEECAKIEASEDLNSLKIDKVFNDKPKNFCEKGANGRWFMDKEAFASHLADVIELPMHLKKRTNSEGRVTNPDFRYAFRADRPFGPEDPADCEKHAYRTRINSLVSMVDRYLAGGIKKNKTFRIFKDDVDISTRPDVPAPTLQTLLADGSSYKIECLIVKPGEKPGGSGSGGGAPATAAKDAEKAPPSALPGNFRVGGTPEDLFKTTKKSKPFTAGLTTDNVKNQKTVNFDGVVGLTFSGTGADFADDRTQKMRADMSGQRDLWWLNYAIYGLVKVQDQNPDSSQKPDISYFAPGVAVNYTFVRKDGSFAYDLQANASPFFDTKNGSVFYAADLIFSPSFRVGDHILFGAPLPVLGPLKVVPDLSLISRYVIIEDAGKSRLFKDADNYFSAGFDSAAEFYLLDVSDLLSNFSVSLGYGRRFNTNGIADVERFSVGLNYKPTSENFTVSLTYIDGPDVNTLQDEERLQLTVGIKY